VYCNKLGRRQEETEAEGCGSPAQGEGGKTHVPLEEASCGVRLHPGGGHDRLLHFGHHQEFSGLTSEGYLHYYLHKIGLVPGPDKAKKD